MLLTQFQKGLAGVSADQMKNVVIAYEPLWAIGAKALRAATPNEANEAHRFIRGLLLNIYGNEVAANIRIQYGGSMNPGNVVELIEQLNIDGGLIGGASLKPDQFIQLIEAMIKSRSELRHLEGAKRELTEVEVSSIKGLLDALAAKDEMRQGEVIAGLFDLHAELGERLASQILGEYMILDLDGIAALPLRPIGARTEQSQTRSESGAALPVTQKSRVVVDVRDQDVTTLSLGSLNEMLHEFSDHSGITLLVTEGEASRLLAERELLGIQESRLRIVTGGVEAVVERELEQIGVSVSAELVTQFTPAQEVREMAGIYRDALIRALMRIAKPGEVTVLSWGEQMRIRAQAVHYRSISLQDFVDALERAEKAGVLVRQSA